MVIKHPVNGLLNVLVAEVLVGIPALQKWSAAPHSIESRPLRAYLSHGFLLVATVPLLVLNIVNGEMYAERQETDAGQRLQEAATAIREDVDDYLKHHQLALLSLSRAIANEGRFGADTLNRRLEQNHALYPGFQTLTISNVDGVPISVHPSVCRTAGKPSTSNPKRRPMTAPLCAIAITSSKLSPPGNLLSRMSTSAARRGNRWLRLRRHSSIRRVTCLVSWPAH